MSVPCAAGPRTLLRHEGESGQGDVHVPLMVLAQAKRASDDSDEPNGSDQEQAQTLGLMGAVALGPGHQDLVVGARRLAAARGPSGRQSRAAADGGNAPPAHAG
jgi:hypothetical protein